MKHELIEWLNEHHPQKFAEDWDNVGLLVGDDQKEISHVFLALDLTRNRCWMRQCLLVPDMILTHHPNDLFGIKKINNHAPEEDPPSDKGRISRNLPCIPIMM